MADDQNQKPSDSGAAPSKASTIDDLVKELSKNNKPNPPLSDKPAANPSPLFSGTASQGPPPNLPGIKLPAVERPSANVDVPLSSVPKGPIPAPRPQPVLPTGTPKPLPKSLPATGIPAQGLGTSPPLGIPKPQGSVPAPQQKPTSVAGSPVQEYKSSIRTMGEDITSIKSGQKPSGVDVPRKVTPEAPKASLPGAPKLETPAPGGPRQVGLGQAERTGPLPSIPGPKAAAPGRPWPITGLGQTEKTGPLPTAPTPQKPAGPLKPPGIQPSITVPKEKKGISMTFYLLIAGILVVGGFLYWFLALRVPAPEVVLSPIPTPTQTVTPTPVIRDLSNIFVGTPVNFEVVLSDDVSGDFKTFVSTLTVAGGEFLKVDLVQDVDGTLAPLNWLDMFDMDLTVYPFGLRNNVADLATLVYGQTETFNEDGAINFSAQDIKKTVFAARISDAAAVETMMMDWELTLADDLADYLLIDDTSKEESVNFLDNAYRGVAIRYKNFPFPDITVDYALVEAAGLPAQAGRDYLVIAGSREAMYSAIDILLEQ